MVITTTNRAAYSAATEATQDVPPALPVPPLPGRRRGRKGHRPVGKVSTGLYPEVSRTKLAKATGRHVSTVTGYLQGRIAPPLTVAVTMAKRIGMTVERLNRDLARKREEYERERRGRYGAE